MEKITKKRRLSAKAAGVLRFGLPIITAYLLYILVFLEIGSASRQLGLTGSVLSMLENVMLSLTLLVGASLLFDLEDKKRGS